MALKLVSFSLCAENNDDNVVPASSSSSSSSSSWSRIQLLKGGIDKRGDRDPSEELASVTASPPLPLPLTRKPFIVSKAPLDLEDNWPQPSRVCEKEAFVEEQEEVGVAEEEEAAAPIEEDDWVWPMLIEKRPVRASRLLLARSK